jgi:hypothetical protein
MLGVRKLAKDRIKVYYWADGTWCIEKDLHYYITCIISDDYSEITVDAGVNIDALIALLLS